MGMAKTTLAKPASLIAAILGMQFLSSGHCRGQNASSQVRDSAGIRIIESAEATGARPLGWSISQKPTVDIGAVEGEAAYTFSDIEGITRRGQYIIVLDGASSELRYYDESGAYRRKVGRRGGGPGESVYPQLVPSLALDSLIVFDRRNGRFTVFDLNGRVVRTSGSTRLIGHALGAVAERVLLLQTNMRFRTGEGPSSTSAAFFWASTRTGQGESIGSFAGRSVFQMNMPGTPGVQFNVPFDVMPTGAVNSSGLLINDGEGPDILHFDAHGKLREIFRVLRSQRQASAADLDAYTRAQARRLHRETIEVMKRAHARMQLPKNLPVYQSLLVDRLGWIWAQKYRIDRDAADHWVVFDPTGRARGTVAMPEGLEVHEIGADYILAQWKDDFDVEHVRQYSLSRRTR